MVIASPWGNAVQQCGNASSRRLARWPCSFAIKGASAMLTRVDNKIISVN